MTSGRRRPRGASSLNDPPEPNRKGDRFRQAARQPLFLVGSGILLLIAFALRIHELALPRPFDLDEGVYWESLRAMGHGAILYRDIYYSQPPLFLLAVFPWYQAFGHSIFSARLGVVFASMVGICGASILGASVSDCLGSLATVVLLIASVPYLAMSQTLQAEGPAIGIATLAVAIAFAAQRCDSNNRAIPLFAITGVCATIALFSKLLAISSFVPIIILIVGESFPRRWGSAWPRRTLFRGASFLAGVTVVVGITFAYFYQRIGALLTQTVAYHIAAASVYHTGDDQNLPRIAIFCASPLGLAASVGFVIALLNRERNLFPMASWLLATCIMLWLLVPLFEHHLVVLVPPLAGLSALSFAPIKKAAIQRSGLRPSRLVAAAVVLLAATLGAIGQRTYYVDVAFRQIYGSDHAMDLRVIKEISSYVRPGQLIVTDAQFLAAEAGIDTPPWLADATLVRVRSGQLTTERLIDETSSPRVKGVLFYGNRLAQVQAFHAWVSRHFDRVAAFGGSDEFWVRPPSHNLGSRSRMVTGVSPSMR